MGVVVIIVDVSLKFMFVLKKIGRDGESSRTLHFLSLKMKRFM